MIPGNTTSLKIRHGRNQYIRIGRPVGPSLVKTGTQEWGMCEREQRPSILAIRRYLKEQYKFPDEQIDTMMPSFLATLDGHMEFLGKAMAEKGSVEVGKAAHTIKGAFLNLGLHDCAELAKQIEAKGKRGQSKDDLVPLVAELQAKISALLAK